MSRQTMLVAAALGGFALTTPPMCAQAQSGDALVRAEYACFENGVRPNSVAFDACVNRTARAFARGEPEIAYRAARAYTDAPRATAIVDEYGRRYDRYGNRLDQDGYLMMTPVRYITVP